MYCLLYATSFQLQAKIYSVLWIGTIYLYFTQKEFFSFWSTNVFHMNFLFKKKLNNHQTYFKFFSCFILFYSMVPFSLLFIVFPICCIEKKNVRPTTKKKNRFINLVESFSNWSAVVVTIVIVKCNLVNKKKAGYTQKK